MRVFCSFQQVGFEVVASILLSPFIVLNWLYGDQKLGIGLNMVLKHPFTRFGARFYYWCRYWDWKKMAAGAGSFFEISPYKISVISTATHYTALLCSVVDVWLCELCGGEEGAVVARSIVTQEWGTGLSTPTGRYDYYYTVSIFSISLCKLLRSPTSLDLAKARRVAIAK